MIALTIRRVFQSVIVMLTVALVAVTLFRYVGDPVSQMVGQETSIADMERLRQELGLNEPVIVQFARFAWNTIQGEFGISYRLGRPVNELFVERLPATLELSLVAALFSLVIGIPMGVYTGLYPDRILSKVFQAVSLIGIALPTFLIGILLILFFGVLLGWLPTFGRGEVVQLGWWSTGLLTSSGLKAIIMPAFTLGMFQLTLIMRLVRSEMMEVLRTDYIKFARARSDRPRGQFRPCLKKHLGAGHHHHRPPDRVDYRLCHYHGDRFSMAWHGVAVSAGNSICRYSGDVDLSHFNCVFLCRDQLDCRHSVSRGGSAVEI